MIVFMNRHFTSICILYTVSTVALHFEFACSGVHTGYRVHHFTSSPNPAIPHIIIVPSTVVNINEFVNYYK